MMSLKQYIAGMVHEWQIVDGKPHFMVWPPFSKLQHLFELLGIEFDKGTVIYVLGNSDEGYYLFVDLTAVVGTKSDIDLEQMFTDER